MITKKLFPFLLCVWLCMACNNRKNYETEDIKSQLVFTENAENYKKYKVDSWKRKPRKRVYLSEINSTLLREYQYDKTENKYIVKK